MFAFAGCVQSSGVDDVPPGENTYVINGEQQAFNSVTAERRGDVLDGVHEGDGPDNDQPQRRQFFFGSGQFRERLRRRKGFQGLVHDLPACVDQRRVSDVHDTAVVVGGDFRPDGRVRRRQRDEIRVRHGIGASLLDGALDLPVHGRLSFAESLELGLISSWLVVSLTTPA